MRNATTRPGGQQRIYRRAAVREPRERLLVVCGGVETEPAYVKGLRSHARNNAVHVDVLEKGRSPSQVVDYGVRVATAARDAYDELWCGVDVDQFGDDLFLAEVKARRCSELRVCSIVSNPCFELWLLLHFSDHRKHCPDYKQIRPLLLKHVPGYAKNTLDFARDGYADTYRTAMDRAKEPEPTGTRFANNPSTNMWRLVEAMSN